MSETTQRILAPVFLACLLVCLLVAAFWRPGAQEAPPTKHQVVLLVPDLTVQDLRNAENYPALAQLARQSVVAVTPAPQLIVRKSHKLPDDVCSVVDWPVPSGRGNILFVPPATDYSVPDGYRTDGSALGDEILRAMGETQGTPLVAQYDDICRTERYAPLAMPDVTRNQRIESLKRLDPILARLTGEHGLPQDVCLLLVSGAASASSPSGETLCPVLLWRRAGAPGLLVSQTVRYTPGLITRNDMIATVAALVGRPNPSSTGHGAVVLPDEKSIERLAQGVGVWGHQARARRLIDGLPWLLIPFLALMAAAHFAAGGSIVALRGAYLAVALFLIIDLLLGSPALSRTPLAHEVAAGGRLYGLGGAASGLLVGTGILGIFLFGDKVARLSLWGAILFIVLLIPTLGGDTGGAIAALGGIVTLAVLNGPVLEWYRRALWIGVPAVVLLGAILTVYLFRNGLAGFLAARNPAVYLAHPAWLVMLILLGAGCYYLWKRPGARLHREEYASLIAIFVSTGLFVVADNNGLPGAAACLLCALPWLVVANTPRWTEGAGLRNDEPEGDGGKE